MSLSGDGYCSDITGADSDCLWPLVGYADVVVVLQADGGGDGTGDAILGGQLRQNSLPADSGLPP